MGVNKRHYVKICKQESLIVVCQCMGCRLRIWLTAEEKQTLEELRRANGVPQRTKDRATVLLLNARGLKNEQIAQGLSWALSTVRHTIHRWQTRGLVGLWDAPRKGGKPRYSESDLVTLETYIQTHPRSYNCKQLATILRQQCQVNLSPDRIRRVLKKRGGFGKDCEKVHPKQNQTLTSASNKQIY